MLKHQGLGFMDKKSFILYKDSLSVLDELSDEQAGRLFKAIKAYQLRSGERSDLDADAGSDCGIKEFVIRVAFAPFKAQFERDNETYENKIKAQSNNGKKGGNPNFQKGQTNPYYQKDNPTLTNITQDKPSDSVSLSDSDSDSDTNNINISPKRKNFVKPTLEEISTYCQERKNSVNPSKFFDFYESKGWLVGKNKMKDWQASVRTWEKNNYNATSPPLKVSQRTNFLDIPEAT